MSGTQIGSSFEITERNRVARRPMRGRYDRATVYDILDSAMVCHIAYVVDGQPYCTPTSFWREGNHIYWHGSSASRMIRNQAAGIPLCLTVTHADAIVLARSGFNHSVNYRSAMVYGKARAVEDEGEKAAAMDRFIDRFFPGRSKLLRPATEAEIKATTILRMEIEQASAKIRNEAMHDDEEDYATPAWTALFPIRTVVGAAVECPRQMEGVTRPEGMSSYVAERNLDEVMLECHRKVFGGGR